MTQLPDTANERGALILKKEMPTDVVGSPGAGEHRSSEPLGPIYRFDRRLEERARTSGWAQVLCTNPYCTFLGGTKELVDFSQNGLGILSECEVPIGEVVEVRLAPFKVRGKVGVVSRCELIAENEPGESGEADGADIKVRRLYKVGISFRRACHAA